ncbi:hypothetical protein SNE40_007954 [Patella caerulea]|uniref:Uncharacterized protein n=1 Tax=Patella caerulea TaxID=87958 RepID=A0AAN8PY55_PATCE
MFSVKLIIFLAAIQSFHCLPAVSQRRVSSAHQFSNADSLRCMQATERCMAPLNFLRDAFVKLDFSSVTASQVNGFCSAHLEQAKTCLRDIVCIIPMPHLKVISRLITWLCSTKDDFIKSKSCFTSESFRVHAKPCFTPPTMMCTSGNCPTPYTSLASCLTPYLQQDQDCTSEHISYIARYFQNLDMRNV